MLCYKWRSRVARRSPTAFTPLGLLVCSGRLLRYEIERTTPRLRILEGSSRGHDTSKPGDRVNTTSDMLRYPRSAGRIVQRNEDKIDVLG